MVAARAQGAKIAIGVVVGVVSVGLIVGAVLFVGHRKGWLHLPGSKRI